MIPTLLTFLGLLMVCILLDLDLWLWSIPPFVETYEGRYD